MSRIMLVIASLLLSLAVSTVHGLHANGFTWSATPMLIPNSVTQYASQTGPQVTTFNYDIYLAYNGADSTHIYTQYMDWDTTRVWSSPVAMNGASSYGGASLAVYETFDLVAAWSDASTSTLRLAILESNGQWGQFSDTSYSCFPGPPAVWVPDSADFEVYYRAATSTTYYNTTWDGYYQFPQYASSTVQSYGHGSVGANYIDVYYYIFYLGVTSSGQPDGYIHVIRQDSATSAWGAPSKLAYAVDSDSTLSAGTWYDDTNQYIYVFYKYNGNITYFVQTPSLTSPGSVSYTPSGPAGYPTWLTSLSGPSVVIYQDPYYDTQIVSVFFSANNPSTGGVSVYNAIGIPDSWP